MSEWVKHDGAAPAFVFKSQLMYIRYDLGGVPPPKVPDLTGPDWPSWYWRWKRVRTGVFKSEMRRVCDDPAYAPITAYKFEDSDDGEVKAALPAVFEAIQRDPLSVVIPDDAPQKVRA